MPAQSARYEDRIAARSATKAATWYGEDDPIVIEDDCPATDHLTLDELLLIARRRNAARRLARALTKTKWKLRVAPEPEAA